MRLKPTLKVVIPLIALVGAVAIAGVLQATRPELAPAPPEERSWLVSTMAAEVGSVQPEIVAYGEIVAVRDAELRAPVAGEIIETASFFLDGAEVKAGDLLVRIDPFDYEIVAGEAKAALAESKARLAEIEAQIAAERASLEHDDAQVVLMERELARRTRLKEGGVLAEQALDETRMQWRQELQARDLRRENIRAYEARADQTRAAIQRNELTYKRAMRDLDDTSILAPFDGTLADTEGSIGKRLAVNDRIARLVDLSTLEAQFHLSDEVYGRLVSGATRLEQKRATVIWHSGGSEAKSYDATIARVGGSTDAQSGGIELFARLDTIDSETPLRPGAFVEIHLPDRLYTNATQLPDTALHDDATIYVIEEGRLVSRPVELLARVGNDVVVRGAVSTGDPIVITRFAEIGEGAKVTTR